MIAVRHWSRVSATGMVAATLGLAVDGAVAADNTLEEIVVTAQKREQNLQSVGTSITALDAAALADRGLANTTDIAAMTPGLQFNQYSPTITVYNLRGVSQNDFSDHQEAPVAVYVDDAYVAAMGALAGSMFDLDRVEILRGPQGTLFGRNATGGLIHYVSKRPSSDASGSLQLTGGNFGTFNSEGFINGALTDSIAGRLSFATDYHDGYITNLIGPKIGNQKQSAARAQLLFHPSANGDVLLSLHGLKNDHEVSGIYSYQASQADPATGLGSYVGPADPADPFTQSEDRIGLFDRTVWGATVHVDWKLSGGAQFTAVSDYLHLSKDYGEDSDVQPVAIFNYDTHQNYHQFSQELRLNGDRGALRWIIGAYYLDYTTENQAIPNIVGLTAPGGGAYFSLKNQTYSGFGQIERDFATGWTGILGARYTNDSKTYDYRYAPELGGTVPQDVAVQYDDKHDWNIGSFKVELDHKLAGGNLFYASYNRGAKGGGYSAPSIGPIDPAGLRFEPEHLDSYELGLKTEFWNRSARLNTAVFYYDYKNYQGFVLSGPTQVVKNLDATVKGAEVEFAVVPSNGLNIELGASVLDANAKSVPLPSGIMLDREMPQAPKLSLNASVRYEWPAAGGKMSVEGDTKWSEKQYLELVNAPVDLQRAYALSNARLGYKSGNEAWDLDAFVRNLSNEKYKVYNLDLSGPFGFNQGVYGMPRTYGLQFAYHWGKK